MAKLSLFLSYNDMFRPAVTADDLVLLHALASR